MNDAPIQASPPIAATQLATARTATCVRQIPGREGGEPVILLHGNPGSSVFLFPIMQHLPGRYRPLAVDLRGFGGSDPDPVDATRGMRDFSDDVLAAMDALGVDAAHLIGWSLGGAVAMQIAIDAPRRVRSLALIAPVSPYGLGGTVDASGTLLAPDAAGSGAGLVSRRFLAALAKGDLTSPAGPRGLLRTLMTAPGWDRADEEELLASMLSTTVGPDNYPGDVADSPHWPGFAPGARGVMNALSPRYCDLSPLAETDPKPPILWVRGAADGVISDRSSMDIAVRKAEAADYPGTGAAPPQPMLAQTRAVLERYAEGGGSVREVVLAGVGHCPQVEDLPRLMEAVIPHLDGADRD